MAPNPNLQRLHEAGVSIWLDTLSRELLDSGEFAELIRDSSITGATSNPTIFAKAITGSDLYDEQLRQLAASGQSDTRELFFSLALDDIRDAAELLRPEYDRAGGADGFISFECTPDLADDTDATVAQAIDLWQRIDQPNAMIKVPGTDAGVPAIQELTRRGVNVNITLLFSVERYEEVIDAYLRGLRARLDAGEPLESISSVASFFLSRIDTKVDAQLPEDSPLRGRLALASARVAYQRYLAIRRAGMGTPRTRRRQTTATAMGQHRNQEPRVLRRAVRRRTDRARRRQHDARADAAGVRRPRPGQPHARRRPSRGGANHPRGAGRWDRSRSGDLRARARGRPVLLRLLRRAHQLHQRQARDRTSHSRVSTGRVRAGERGDELLARSHACLVEDRLEVVLHGVGREEQPLGDGAGVAARRAGG